MSENPSQEQRSNNRIAFDAPVTISDPKGQWQSTMLDISLKGALINRPRGWHGETGKSWELNIPLSGDDVRIRMEASVRHIEDDHIGFHCEHIDLDSITNLRRLISLNLADESLLDRELSSLVR